MNLSQRTVPVINPYFFPYCLSDRPLPALPLPSTYRPSSERPVQIPCIQPGVDGDPDPGPHLIGLRTYGLPAVSTIVMGDYRSVMQMPHLERLLYTSAHPSVEEFSRRQSGKILAGESGALFGEEYSTQAGPRRGFVDTLGNGAAP